MNAIEYAADLSTRYPEYWFTETFLASIYTYKGGYGVGSYELEHGRVEI
mgnify:CR=1 FL=1